MTSFIVQYWLEMLFGAIAAAAGVLAKKFYGLYKKEQKHQEERKKDNFKKVIHEDFISAVEENRKLSDERADKLNKEINLLSNNLQVLQEGILSIQGHSFKHDCQILLEEDHEITPNEWEEIDIDHTVYNSLGGNHEGDRLYKDVETKYRNSL